MPPGSRSTHATADVVKSVTRHPPHLSTAADYHYPSAAYRRPMPVAPTPYPMHGPRSITAPILATPRVSLAAAAAAATAPNMGHWYGQAAAYADAAAPMGHAAAFTAHTIYPFPAYYVIVRAARRRALPQKIGRAPAPAASALGSRAVYWLSQGIGGILPPPQGRC